MASSGNSIIIIVHMAAQNLGEKLDVKHKVESTEVMRRRPQQAINNQLKEDDDQKALSYIFL